MNTQPQNDVPTFRQEEESTGHPVLGRIAWVLVMVVIRLIVHGMFK